MSPDDLTRHSIVNARVEMAADAWELSGLADEWFTTLEDEFPGVES